VRPAWAHDRQSARPLPVASYTLRARLDTEFHRVEASGTITFTNRTSVAVTELWFHLYPDAFRNDRTRFWRTAAATRRNRRQLHRSGQLDVLELLTREPQPKNLWDSADQTTPDDPDDTTDRRVALEQPLEPNETLVLDVKFVTQLPFIVERMGWVESFHAVAQWFPKLARLEPDGTWRHFPYEALAEFYADFGDYDITVDVPQSFSVAAPGESSVLSEANGRRVTRFRMPHVHDFAWFAWDGFEQTQRTVAGVRIHAYSPPGHARNSSLELAEIARALPQMQSWFGPYPYAGLVLVHPPDVAAPAGGMEYPGLIVTGGPWYSSLTDSRQLSAVTLHELAHQWFYGIVATDEARYPVLDEGLATWTELHALTEEYGSGSAFTGLGLTVSASAIAQLMGASGYKRGPLARPATSFTTFSQLTRSVYARTSLLLQTFGNVYGQAKLLAALRRYALENRFEHPGPQTLIAALQGELGTVAAKNLEVAFESDGWVEFEPTRLISRAIAGGRWSNAVCVRRLGTLELPVRVEVALADGQRFTHECSAAPSECAFEFESRVPATSVTVDPKHAIAIESRWSNNTLWQTTPPKPRLLLEQLFYSLQLLLGVLS
jgi:hypothetical protein